MIVFITEPGGYNPSIALLIKYPASPLAAVAPCIATFISFGSYDGLDTIASISPVFGFNATTAPFLSPSIS